MSRSLFLAASAVMTLGLGLRAQDDSPALVVMTADENTAAGLFDDMGDGELPALDQGQHWVMTLGSDGKLKATTADGEVGFLRARVRPGKLMDVFADKIAESQQMAGMIGGMVAAQSGMNARDVNKLIDDAFEFPRQIDSLAIDVTGSEKTGFDASVVVATVAGGWFADFVESMNHSELGAPELGNADSLARVRVDLDSKTLNRLVAPFAGFTLGAADSDAEREKYSKLLSSQMQLMDGSMALTFNPESGGMQALMGLIDAGKARTLVTSEDYLEWMKAAAEANPMADVEIEPQGLTHRDVTMLKQTVDTGQPTPFSEDGTMLTFSGVTGSFFAMAQMGSGENDVKGLIDQILDAKIKRGKLAAGAVLDATVKPAELAAMMSRGMGGGDGAPESLAVTMTKNGSALEFKIKVGF